MNSLEASTLCRMAASSGIRTRWRLRATRTISFSDKPSPRIVRAEVSWFDSAGDDETAKYADSIVFAFREANASDQQPYCLLEWIANYPLLTGPKMLHQF